MTVNTELPAYFISHGGGPWPWMPQELTDFYPKLAAALASIIPSLPQRPQAILLISAHWEQPVFTVQSSPLPGMVYDYYGFPEYTYSVRYASSGSPALAHRVMQLLAHNGVPAAEDKERGYDHGMFSPMEIMHPAADIPVVQLSLKEGLRPLEHIALGRALRPLRQEGVFIVGSGLSYHNLRLFNAAGREPSRQFDAWLNETVTGQSGEIRNRLLENWTAAPSARLAHPREEHLLPLMVAVGCAEDQPGVNTYHQDDFMGSLSVSNFRFG